MKKLLILSMTLLPLLFTSSIQAKLPETIKFASEATYPPFESINPSGELQGFDIDIAKAICDQMDFKCTFSHQPWVSLLTGLEQGKFDAVISAMSITAERQWKVDFSDAYFNPTGSFIIRNNYTLSTTPQDLKGKTVGVQKSSTFENYLNNQYKDIINIKTYPNFQKLMMDLSVEEPADYPVKTYNFETEIALDLSVGRIDAALGDTPIIENWLNTDDNRNYFKVAGEPINDLEIFGVGYGIAVRKNNEELLDKINEGLKKIKENGTYQKIFSTYFPEGKTLATSQNQP